MIQNAYFNEYQEWEMYGVSGRRLKKPRKGQMVPGVSDACVIGFLDFHKYGEHIHEYGPHIYEYE